MGGQWRAPVGALAELQRILSSVGAGPAAGFYAIIFAANDGGEIILRTLSLSVFALKITTDPDLGNVPQGQAATRTLGGHVRGQRVCLSGVSLHFLVSSLRGDALDGRDPDGPGHDVHRALHVRPDGHRGRRLVLAPHGPGRRRVADHAPSISTGFLNSGDCTFGVPCSRTVNVNNGGGGPFTWSATGLPDGLMIRYGNAVTSRFINPGDAEIVGVPRQLGTFVVTVTVTDGAGGQATQIYPLTISALVSRDFFNVGDRGVPYSGRFRIFGGVPEYSATIVAGSLPAGLSFNSATQTISGTPVENGSFSLTLLVADSSVPAKTLRLSQSLQIGGGTSTIAIGTTELPRGFISAPPSGPAWYSGSLSACCIPGPLNWSLVTGTLPVGLALNPATGQITGTIAQSSTPGLYTFRFKAASAADPSNFGIRDVLLRLTALDVASPSSGTLPDGNVGTPYPAADVHRERRLRPAHVDTRGEQPAAARADAVAGWRAERNADGLRPDLLHRVGKRRRGQRRDAVLQPVDLPRRPVSPAHAVGRSIHQRSRCLHTRDHAKHGERRCRAVHLPR